MFLKSRREEILVLITLGVSLFLNFYNLEHLPPAFHNDEAETGLEALRILQGQSRLIGLSNFYNLPLSSFLPYSLTILLFGRSVFAVRAASALVGSFSLLFFFYLIKIIFDKKIALLATALLSFSHFWIAFSRLGINYNLSVFFEIITFIFLIKTIKNGRLRDSFLLGVFGGSSLYLYFSSRIVPIIVIGVLAFDFLRNSGNLKLKAVSLVLLGFLLTALPMFFVYAKTPKGFISRINNVFVFSPEVKPWLRDIYKTDSKIKTLVLQAKRTLDLSSQQCEGSGQYGYCGRILDIPTLLFFSLGMFLSFLRINRLRDFFLLFWFWMIIIFGSFLTVPPIFMPRILGALPVVYVFFGVGFYSLKSLLVKKFRSKNVNLKMLFNIAFIAVIIFIIFNNLKIYFVKYPKRIWGDFNKYTATRIPRIIKNYPDYQFIFLTKPFLHADFSTLAYIAPETERIEIEKPTDYSFDLGVYRVIYVFYPKYYQKLSEARKIYPSAKPIEVKVSSESQPSAYLLKVD